MIFIQDLIAGWQSVAPISYSQFETYLEDGRVASLVVGSDTITGAFTELVDGKSQFVTTVVDPGILQRIDRSGVEITGVPQNTFFGTLISWVAPALVFFGIWMLAATNRPEILDPALLRAGRFDRQVLVDRPDKTGRVQILNVHMKKVTLAPDVDAEKVAALTPGSSGADLANLVNEAALLATRRKADAVTMDDFNNAVERIIAGLEKKNRVLNPREREIVAQHEMGHALVAMALPGVDPVHKVSIIKRGIGALGYTIQRRPRTAS